jgi:hypothetical protein
MDRIGAGDFVQYQTPVCLSGDHLGRDDRRNPRYRFCLGILAHRPFSLNLIAFE